MWSNINLKSILVLLQYLSLSISGTLALLGLLYNYKDKDTGKLTRWGRIALIGLVVSVVTGLVSKNIEFYLQRKAQELEAVKSRTAAEQTLSVVTNVERMVSSVQHIRVTLRLWIPIEASFLIEFRDEIHKRLGASESDSDQDLSEAKFRNLISSQRWQRIADALLRPDHVAMLVYPKGKDLPNCVRQLDNKPLIRFEIPIEIKSIDYPQGGGGFGLLIETDITQDAKLRPQVISLLDFNEGTAIIYCLVPPPVIKEVPPSTVPSQGPADASKPEFDETFPPTPWQVGDVELIFDEHRKVYINSPKIKQDCSGFAYSIAPITAQATNNEAQPGG